MLNMKSIGLLHTINIKQNLFINNVPITKAGLIAAAHLGGARSVKLYLKSNGKINREDAYGTSIEDYLLEFSIFDI